MKERYLSLSIILFTGFFAVSVGAYDPDKIHVKLTQDAIKKVLSCARFDSSWNDVSGIIELSSGDCQSDMKNGNKDEDDIMRRSRQINWHFYDPNNKNEHAVLGVRKLVDFSWEVCSISGHSLCQLIKNLSDSDVSEVHLTPLRHMETLIRNLNAVDPKPMTERCQLLGALLHYVEDMTVPAHVVPVFHPTSRPTLFKLFKDMRLYHKDPVDEWPLQDTGDVSPEDCERIASTVPTAVDNLFIIEEIFKETARTTKGRLEEKICSGTQAKWRPRIYYNSGGEKVVPYHSYFGSYPKAVEFGDVSQFVCDDKSPWQAYNQFVAARHRQAVEADMRAILAALRYFRTHQNKK